MSYVLESTFPMISLRSAKSSLSPSECCFMLRGFWNPFAFGRFFVWTSHDLGVDQNVRLFNVQLMLMHDCLAVVGRRSVFAFDIEGAAAK